MVHSLETTATYKYKTNQLKQDGYDTSVVSGNLYLVNHSEKTYEVMTDEVSEQIKKGEMKLKWILRIEIFGMIDLVIIGVMCFFFDLVLLYW